jgi:GMP synthase (glutamine-hydrolysing)
MPKLLVFQHVAFEILGTLNPLLRDEGFRIRYVNFGRHPHARPSLEGYHGLVVLGGPMSVHDTDEHPHLRTEIGVIQDAIDTGIPVLGICLGAQLIAAALGATVTRNPEPEIGWYDVTPTREARGDALLRHFRSSEKLFQWHSDACEIPRGAVHLASSRSCVHQAFRYGTNVYGLQFHLEVDEPLVERWLRVPIHRRELEALRGPDGAEQIRRATPLYIERTKRLSDRTFRGFVELFGPRRRFRHLPSR